MAKLTMVVGFNSRFKLYNNEKHRTSFQILVVVFLVALALFLCFEIWSLTSFNTDLIVVTSKPTELNYAVVIDAGSSGSRAYLYKWPDHSGNPRDLLEISPLTDENHNPLVEKVIPGLSSLGDTPEKSFNYLKPLLDFAHKRIPEKSHKETSLFVLATAGMRLLDTTKQEKILANIRQGISSNSVFMFPETNLEVISGKQEGIYQWLAVNYVLGNFKNLPLIPSRVRQDKRPKTVGALDMGGASVQIATEITEENDLSESDKARIVEINLGSREHDVDHTYKLFVTTFLGYGANEAYERSKRAIFLSQIVPSDKSNQSISSIEFRGLSNSSRLENPCLSSGMMSNDPLGVPSSALIDNLSIKDKLAQNQHMFFIGTGDWKNCYNFIKNFTVKSDPFIKCVGSCPDDGIKLPNLHLDKMEFYGFSELWYSTNDLLNLGSSYSYQSFSSAAEKYCAQPWKDTWANYQNDKYLKADKDRLMSQCFKSAWVAVVLHEGFKFPYSYSLLSVAPNTVKGKVVHWTIGALLYRTRFFPLRAIESHLKGEQVHHGPSHSIWGSKYSQYIVVMCLILVICFIYGYILRLKNYVKPSTLRRVPSKIAFWSLGKNQVDDAKINLMSGFDDDVTLTSVVVN